MRFADVVSVIVLLGVVGWGASILGYQDGHQATTQKDLVDYIEREAVETFVENIERSCENVNTSFDEVPKIHIHSEKYEPLAEVKCLLEAR